MYLTVAQMRNRRNFKYIYVYIYGMVVRKLDMHGMIAVSNVRAPSHHKLITHSPSSPLVLAMGKRRLSVAPVMNTF